MGQTLCKDGQLALQTDCQKQEVWKIENELYKGVEMLSETKDIQTIEAMGELGFFTDDNIDEIIEMMGKGDKKELTAWFMSYKNRSLKSKGGFDFML